MAKAIGRGGGKSSSKRRTPAPTSGKAPLAAAATPCPVVALGASAGGLEAFTRFVESTPADSGLAFVLIQHLDPKHESLMPELLGARTKMKVAHPKDGEALEPNRIYVIPPKALMTVRGGMLRLEPQPEGVHARMPIDVFFRSLAEDQREKAIGVVLTGTGTDGTLGAKEIKAQGGLVAAQDPREAQHAGMPRSAITSGVVDLVLPVDDIARSLIDYVGASYFKAVDAPTILGEKAREALPGIIDFFRDNSAVDFALYKEGTAAAADRAPDGAQPHRNGRGLPQSRARESR